MEYCLKAGRKVGRSYVLWLGLNEVIDQLVMADIVHWYGHLVVEGGW